MRFDPVDMQAERWNLSFRSTATDRVSSHDGGGWFQTALVSNLSNCGVLPVWILLQTLGIVAELDENRSFAKQTISARQGAVLFTS